MPASSTPKVGDITRYAAQHSRFSTEDINKAFRLGTRNTAAYLAMMRRRGLIKPDSPAKVDGVSQWVFTGKPKRGNGNGDPQKAQFVALAAELGSKFVEGVLEQVRAVEAAQDHLSKLAHT